MNHIHTQTNDHEHTTARERQCLVVSADLSHRLLLSQAAAQVGWQTIEAADATQAIAFTERSTVDLAIVDLETTDDEQTQQLLRMVEQLSEQHSHQRDRLLMVCGNHQRPEEEIWARQLGVWIYVPGLDDAAYEDGADVTALCSHAAEIVDKWIAESTEELCAESALGASPTGALQSQQTWN